MDWTLIPPRTRAEIRRRVFSRDGYICQVRGPDCTGKAEEVDHIVPQALGGVHDDSNLRASCRVCNGQRGVATRQEVEDLKHQVSMQGSSREW